MDFTSHVARVLSPYAPLSTHDSAMTMSLYRPFRSIRRTIQNTPTILVFTHTIPVLTIFVSPQPNAQDPLTESEPDYFFQLLSVPGMHISATITTPLISCSAMARGPR